MLRCRPSEPSFFSQPRSCSRKEGSAERHWGHQMGLGRVRKNIKAAMIDAVEVAGAQMVRLRLCASREIT